MAFSLYCLSHIIIVSDILPNACAKHAPLVRVSEFVVEKRALRHTYIMVGRTIKKCVRAFVCVFVCV